MTLKLEDEVKSVPTISLNLNDYASASAKQSNGTTTTNQPPKLEIPTASTPIRTSSLASPRSEVGTPARELRLEDRSASDIKGTGPDEANTVQTE